MMVIAFWIFTGLLFMFNLACTFVDKFGSTTEETETFNRLEDMCPTWLANILDYVLIMIIPLQGGSFILYTIMRDPFCHDLCIVLSSLESLIIAIALYYIFQLDK